MSTALKLMTVEEFLPWAEGKEGRWELHDGVPVMMSPERSLHAETKAETYVALREAIRLKGLPCRVYPDGMAIRIDARATYEPDASVVCGPRRSRRRHRDRQSGHRGRSPLSEHGRYRPRAQAQRVFLDSQRAALFDPRSRSARSDPPQARRWRGDRDPCALRGRGAARSAGLRGCGRGAVPASLISPGAPPFRT